MKKHILLFFLCTWSSLSFSMDLGIGKVLQNVYDKWDPTTVLKEIEKIGPSNDLRVKMTQQHRLDRLIPYRTEKKETKALCDDLTTIYAKKYPLGNIAVSMAIDYLYKIRSSLLTINKPLFISVTETLDLINPEQILEDFEKKETEKLKPIELETRLNKCIELFAESNNITALQKLIKIIAETNIIPGERVATLAYGCIKRQNLLNEELLKILTEKFKVKPKQAEEQQDKKIEEQK